MTAQPVSPLMMPRRKVVAAPVDEVVYSTTTGQRPRRPLRRNADGSVRRSARRTHPASYGDDIYGAFCFVCSRATEHAGEHEALVEAGMAVYAPNGSVNRTQAWDDEQARAISRAEYQAYLANLGLSTGDDSVAA